MVKDILLVLLGFMVCLLFLKAQYCPGCLQRRWLDRLRKN